MWLQVQQLLIQAGWRDATLRSATQFSRSIETQSFIFNLLNSSNNNQLLLLFGVFWKVKAEYNR